MTRSELLIGLNLIGGIGSIRLRKLLDCFAQPEDILNSPEEELTAVSGINNSLAAEIRNLDKKRIEQEIFLAKEYNLKIITLEDAGYPLNLKHTFDPPIVLYVKGEIKEEDVLSIAVVGSRRASFYGLSCAEEFAGKLSACGLTIISGMARGIDSLAHRAALKQGGRTIAVMGSGFKHIYPPENMELADEISRDGAVVSEFPIDAKPLRQNFPRRNRIISGLSLGVLVVEAAKNSGALITADFALEQGREVFALPGKVDSRTSFGTNGLIKQGARLVSSYEDILEELNLNIPEMPKAGHEQEVNNNILESPEGSLYRLLSKAPTSIDDLIEKSGLDIPNISSILFHLEMKKMVRQLPGKNFLRI